MQNAMIVPGQNLYLHFKPGDEVPPFNAVCEVVSKSFTKGVKKRDAKVQYGLKFVNIVPGAKKAIKEYVSKKGKTKTG